MLAVPRLAFATAYALATACLVGGADDLGADREATVHLLTPETFEHLTQAATGATTGPWLVSFCAGAEYECKRLRRLMPKVATQLVEESEERGKPPANVAIVDTYESPWLAKRFGLSHAPTVILFQLGVMYYYQGGSYTVDRLVHFCHGGYKSSGMSQVPPEPHVPDSHERTFLIACLAVAVVSGALYVVDLLLQRSRSSAKRKRKSK